MRLSPRLAILGVATILALCLPHRAAASDGPGCEAGVCPDGDGDGFVACACALPGAPCDCDDADPAAFPGAPESCDAPKDTSCNGVVADPCAPAAGCLAGVCVARCIPLDDFGCPAGSRFGKADGGEACLCVPDDCSLFGCPPGQTCDDDKTCRANCNPDVRCPHGQKCRGYGCVDPCEGVACPAGASCIEGVCRVSCDCPAGGGCAGGQVCDASKQPPECVDPACAAVTCPAGSHCESGACADDCAGVVCPPKRVCRHVSVGGGPVRGRCVDLCSPDPCSSGFSCDWRTGECTPWAVGDGGFFLPRGDDDELLRVVGGGWTCTATPLAGVSACGVGAALAAALVLFGRRLRRRS